MKTASDDWDEHWSRKFVSLNSVFKWYRQYIMSNALSYYFEKYFPKEGTFVECGSGSSLTSHLVTKHNRKLIAVTITSITLLGILGYSFYHFRSYFISLISRIRRKKANF